MVAQADDEPVPRRLTSMPAGATDLELVPKKDCQGRRSVGTVFANHVDPGVGLSHKCGGTGLSLQHWGRHEDQAVKVVLVAKKVGSQSVYSVSKEEKEGEEEEEEKGYKPRKKITSGSCACAHVCVH